MILPQSFYAHDDVLQIGRDLLGKFLFTSINGSLCGGMIVETEAYRAPDDRACHAYLNRNTNRTKTMFLQGGVCYVYLCYGVHHMINVVTSTKGHAHAILIRAIEPTEGIDMMLERRKQQRLQRSTTNGPGKVAQALGADKSMDAVDLCDPSSSIWIEDGGVHVPDHQIVTGPRVGMSIHVGSSAHLPWRFSIKDNPWVSSPREVKYPHIPKV